ncbi:peptidase M16 [Weizmannia acidilactici]|uniref:Peptidase M16 n=1 Tax=Weizmannia acidilactici TaxID=2607726 RepID=A0A5J4J1N8_9BACI|nr:pitrilysin family protein [Weizmannia acidilactici]GER65688.1 peptidase M16 [Weizmannia acidilactici]GER68982.1 peptidase M16 [Weizmannia acidilactici]GER72045.1 peptidase M16 [Weizmannia acidilactici]
MAIAKETIRKMKGYTLHTIKTDKYKTNTLVWKMKAPLDKDTVTLRALLLNVLQSSTKRYDTTAKLRTYLDELYGASFYVDTAKKGEYHIISFTVEIANEKFLHNAEPLLQKGIQFLAEVLLNPNADGGQFDQAVVEKEKRVLKQRLQAVYDDKMRYANMRLIEEMCKGEPFALQANGIIDEVDAITPESLFAYYQRAIQEDEMDLFVTGDVDEGRLAAFCEALIFPDREATTAAARTLRKVAEVRKIKESQDIRQGKLNIGYRTNIVFGNRDYFAMQMFNGIFGGFSHSKLFLNVREKASLCYYVSSQIESHKGLMMVMSGIESVNYEKAVSIIEKQMEAMKNGDFSVQEMEQTKAVIRNQLLEATDTSRGLVEILYHNVIAKKQIGVDDWIREIEAVEKGEIVKVAAKIELDTIYFLSGSEGK